MPAHHVGVNETRVTPRAITPVNSGESVSPISPLIVSSYPGLLPQDVGGTGLSIFMTRPRQ